MGLLRRLGQRIRGRELGADVKIPAREFVEHLRGLEKSLPVELIDTDARRYGRKGKETLSPNRVANIIAMTMVGPIDFRHQVFSGRNGRKHYWDAKVEVGAFNLIDTEVDYPVLRKLKISYVLPAH